MKDTTTAQVSKSRLTALFAKLKESSFFKNILVVMTGTVIAQVIGFALSPVISRLYSPSDFGIFGSFYAIVRIIEAGTTLEYSQAIMLPKEKEHAINLFVLSCLCTLIIGFLCLIFCSIAPATVHSAMKTEGILVLLLLVLVTIVFGINKSCQAWSVRVKAFKHTSASQVIRSVTSNGTKIGLGFLKGGALALIVSNILANILASLNLIRVLLPDFMALRNSIRWKLIKRLAKEYRDFPMYAASQNIINALSSGLPVLLLTHFYGISISGAYAFGVTVLKFPMEFILTSLRQVLFQKASETQHQRGSLSSLYVKITVGLFITTILPTVILIIWAPKLFVLVFGSQWSMAGELARSLIIWLAVVFCNLPAVLFARIIRIQRFVFFYDLVLLGARALALVLGGLFLSPPQTVMLFSIVGAVMNTILIFRVGHAVMKKERTVNWGNIREILTKG
jgi:lipopolysaccharide exporter